MIVLGLLHIQVAALTAVVLASVFGGLSPWIAVVALAVGVIKPGYLHNRWGVPGVGRRDTGNRGLEWALLGFLLLVGLRHFIWMFYSVDHQFRTLSPNNLGDLPLHINYIRQFANGAAFPPVNPEFAAEPLFYPFGLDLYDALWESLGVPMAAHLFLVGTFLLIASLVLLRAWAGWLGILGFFLNGGWAGWQIFSSGHFTDYQGPLAWKNFLLALFVTQRGLMFALPVGLLILLQMRSVLSREQSLDRRSLWLMGGLWGGLAFFHLHSFAAVSLILAGYSVLFRQLRPLLTAAITAVPLGGFFVLYSTEWLQKSSVIWLRWGWTAADQPLLAFWWQNLGPWLLLIPLVLGVALVRRRWTLVGEVVFHLTLFIGFTWVMLAPWDWDNIKVLIWPYLGLLGVAHRLLPDGTSVESRPRWQHVSWQAVMVAGAGVLGLTGTVSVLSSLNPAEDGVTLYPARELWSMEGALPAVPVDAVLLAAPTYNHPLTYWGRIRVLGYEGHTWSHGIDSTSASQLQTRLFNGDPQWREIARELGATHLVWSPHERMHYGDHPKPWRTALENVSPVPDYEIYRLD